MTDKAPRIIQTQLPLTWLIATAATIVFSFGVMFAELNAVTALVKSIEDKIDKRDQSIAILQTQVITGEGKNLMQDAAILRVNSDVQDLRHEFGEFKDKVGQSRVMLK